MAEGDGVFIIDFRGKKYHASFVDTKVSFEVFTYDLFAGGVDIKQRKVSGITYNSDDGSLDLSLPDTPTGFHVVSTTSTSVTLDWDDVVGEPLTGGGVALTGGGTALTG